MNQPLNKSTSLVERLTQRLDTLGLTPRAASLKTGRGPDVIRNITRAASGKKAYHPRTDTLQLIAAVLETTPEWLLTGQTAQPMKGDQESWSKAPPNGLMPLHSS